MNPPGNPGEAFGAFRALATQDSDLLAGFPKLQDIDKVAARAVELEKARGLVFAPRQVRECCLAASRICSEQRAL